MHIFRGILSISGGSEKAFPRGDIVVDVDGKRHAEDRLCINFQGRRQLYTIENWSESLCGRRFDSPGLGAVDVADGTAGDHILGAFVGDTYKLYGPREIP